MKKISKNIKYILSVASFVVVALMANTLTSEAWVYNGISIEYDVTSAPVITVDLTASPTTMTLPTDQTVLSWTTTGSPDSCVGVSTPTGTSWNGMSLSPSGSGGSPVTVSGLAAGTYVFDINCTKVGSSPASDSEVVVVNSASSPSGTLFASGCTIASGGSSCSGSVSWTTANLTLAPTAITRNTGSPASFTPSPLAFGSQGTTLGYGQTDFYLYHNSVILAQSSATATCVGGTSWNGSSCQTTPPPTPSVALSALPSTVFSGNSATLSWTSANVFSCTASASPISATWTGARPTSSSFPHESTGALTATTTFTLSCTGPNGNAGDSKVVTVAIGDPGDIIPDLVANPDRISLGESSLLTWSCQGATSSNGIGFSTGGVLSGSTSVSPTGNTTYTLNCINGPDSASDQATVTLKRRFLFIEF